MQNRILMVLLFVPVVGWSQLQGSSGIEDRTQRYLNLFLRAGQSGSISTDPISSFIDKLEQRKSSFKKDVDFLHYVFTNTHRKFLKRYTDYCTFDALIEKGTYNCLTGTALYALLLDHFDIDYSIVETNYHIFLIIDTTSGRVLFEATDPINGFVDSPDDIDARIKKYREIQPTITHCYRYNFSFYNQVNMEQLVGLMYYNLSVDAYNKKLLPASITYLEQAVKLYKTQRTDEFSRIIFLTLSEGPVKNFESEICLQKLLAIPQKSIVLASNAASADF